MPVGKNDAVSAFWAQEDVPNKEPVNEVAVTPPATSKRFVGELVPIPTLPLPLANTIMSVQVILLPVVPAPAYLNLIWLLPPISIAQAVSLPAYLQAAD